jgi:hypothetical protein
MSYNVEYRFLKSVNAERKGERASTRENINRVLKVTEVTTQSCRSNFNPYHKILKTFQSPRMKSI